MIASKLSPIPERLIVLTFDDACKSDITYVAPLLKEFGFGATFFYTPAFAAGKRPECYCTWDDARAIADMGFEIGNHTAHHPDVTGLTDEQFEAELAAVEAGCREHGIARPVTFCYPGFRWDQRTVGVLRRRGYLWARRGTFPEVTDCHEGQRGLTYDPATHDPLAIPTTGYSGPKYRLEDFSWAMSQAAGGRITVLCFHGIPDVEHPWVHTDPALFRRYMESLRDAGATVIAMKDLARYVSPEPPK